MEKTVWGWRGEEKLLAVIQLNELSLHGFHLWGSNRSEDTDHALQTSDERQQIFDLD